MAICLNPDCKTPFCPGCTATVKPKRTAVIEWTEQATYSVTVELPDECPEAEGNGDNVREWLDGEDTQSGDGESKWWDLVNSQKEDWATHDLVSVDERDLRDITLIDLDGDTIVRQLNGSDSDRDS